MNGKYNGYILMDLESTCWDVQNPMATDLDRHRQKEEMEITEIGAVKTDANFNIIDKFTMFVQPILNPTLSKFCTDLTSITQQDVNNASKFPYVYRKFKTWTERLNGQRGMPTLFLAWGDYDHREMEKNCKLHNMGCCINEGNYMNAKYLFKLYMGRKGKGLQTEIQKAGLTFEGRPHRGIDDSINTARLLYQLKRDFEGDSIL
jgi:inhibitor of KinA sporulation pathway (predicted exonuclease)